MQKVLQFDYSKALDFFSEEELTSMQSEVEGARDTLLKREGAGNDFLGWIDLPLSYDREEFGRIKKAAEKIRSDSEVLLVSVSEAPIWGAGPPLSFWDTAFTICFPRTKERDRRFIFAAIPFPPNIWQI